MVIEVEQSEIQATQESAADIEFCERLIAIMFRRKKEKLLWLVSVGRLTLGQAERRLEQYGQELQPLFERMFATGRHTNGGLYGEGTSNCRCDGALVPC